jgi:hypothetical protein
VSTTRVRQLRCKVPSRQNQLRTSESLTVLERRRKCAVVANEGGAASNLIWAMCHGRRSSSARSIKESDVQLSHVFDRESVQHFRLLFPEMRKSCPHRRTSFEDCLKLSCTRTLTLYMLKDSKMRKTTIAAKMPSRHTACVSI